MYQLHYICKQCPESTGSCVLLDIHFHTEVVYDE